MPEFENNHYESEAETDSSNLESGQLIIVSGPSGAGKSTVLRRLLEECELSLELSISATTRPARKGEVDGRDYHFVTREQFEQMRARGEFLECMEVFGRNWYGTLAHQVDGALQAGKWIILEIDVQGALSVMKLRDDAISFFIHPGTRKELERRLRSRNTDEDAAIERRLDVAEEELSALSYYDHEIVNRDLDLAVQEICQLLKKSAIKGRACLKS